MREFPNSHAGPSYRRLTAFDLERIAERHVAGESDAAIAKIIGCDRSAVRRARSRPSVVNQVRLLRARQLRAQAERDRRVRAKLRKLHGITTDTPLRLEDVAAVPAPAGREGATERGLHVDTGPAAPSSLERHTRVPGQTYPYIDAEGRYHGSNIGTPRLATTRDYTKNGWRVPEGFLDQPRFGPPGFPREAIGTFEPDVRMTHPSTDGRTTITSPVPVSEVDTRLADGWLPAT